MTHRLSRRRFVKQSIGGLVGLGAIPALSVVPRGSARAAALLQGKTITLVDGTVVDSLDNKITAGPNQDMYDLIYRGLVRLDEKRMPQREMADSWTVSKDGKTWSFRLRRGMKFHDDTAVDSEAVKFNIQRLLDPVTKAERANNYRHIEAMDTSDPQVIVFHLSRPDPDFLLLMADVPTSMLISPTAVKKYGSDFGTHAAGAGPMKLTEFSPNQVMFERWEGYYGRPYAFQRYVHRVVPEASTRLAALLRGEADIATTLSPDTVARLRSNPSIRVVAQVSTTQANIELVLAPGSPLADKRVRQALNLSLNKDDIIKGVFNGFGHCVSGPAPAGVQYSYNLGCWAYNPSKARDLLKQAGYGNGFAMDWHYLPLFAGYEQMTQVVQANFSAIGVNLGLINVGDIAGIDAAYSHNPLTWGKPTGRGGYSSSPYAQYQLNRLYNSAATTPPKGFRLSNYKNPEVDNLLNAAAVELDTRKRGDLLRRAEQLIWEDAPFVWVYAPDGIVGTRANIRGVYLSAYSAPVLDKVVLE